MERVGLTDAEKLFFKQSKRIEGGIKNLLHDTLKGKIKQSAIDVFKQKSTLDVLKQKSTMNASSGLGNSRKGTENDVLHDEKRKANEAKDEVNSEKSNDSEKSVKYPNRIYNPHKILGW